MGSNQWRTGGVNFAAGNEIFMNIIAKKLFSNIQMVEKSFMQVPYAHFDKKDKVGRPADFVFQQFQQQQQSSNSNQNNYFAQKQLYHARRRFES